MLDLAQFRAEYPFFASASDELVAAALSKAAQRIGAAWGELENQGHGLLTAHILAIAPEGLSARLEDDKTKTTYIGEYLQLRDVVAIGLRTF